MTEIRENVVYNVLHSLLHVRCWCFSFSFFFFEKRHAFKIRYCTGCLYLNKYGVYYYDNLPQVRRVQERTDGTSEGHRRCAVQVQLTHDPVAVPTKITSKLQSSNYTVYFQTSQP